MIVKVCGITNYMDALSALDAGADALGFNFWPGSPRFVKDTAFLADLPRNFWRVGLFVAEDPQAAADTIAAHALDVAQLHRMDALPGHRVWKALSVDGPLTQAHFDTLQAEATVLDTPAGAIEGGTGRTFPWEFVTGVEGKIVLAGGLDSTNVAQAIQTLRPWGVDACSRLESSPGKKDRDKMRAFIEEARKEFART